MFSVFLTNATDFAKQFNENMKIGEGENNPLGGLTETVSEAGGSSIRLVTVIGFIILTIGLIIAGVKISSPNAKKREEGKQKAFAIIIGSAVLSGIVAIFLLIQGIANGLM